ncbi:reverse transcriptase domain-containing protein [Tanacetum coccineum]|uniref:Reverse transcriptase domain-containing protein n=1 Tax=Tanacetum coccineum TaxID=301880 RepID=A0ABQ5E6X6_9ASTR
MKGPIILMLAYSRWYPIRCGLKRNASMTSLLCMVFLTGDSKDNDSTLTDTHLRVIAELLDTKALLMFVIIKVFSLYGYDYMKKIILRRADLKEFTIAERDFKYLYPSDFEDLRLHTGIESYQTQLNLTKPRWDATGFEFKHDFTVIDSPRAVTFRDKYGVQMIMRFNEIHKFSDGTLQQIDEALDYRVKEFKVNRMNPDKENLPEPGKLCWWKDKRGRLQTAEENRMITSSRQSSFRNSDEYNHDPKKCEHAGPKVTTSHEGNNTKRMIWRFTVADDLKECSKITQVKGTMLKDYYSNLLEDKENAGATYERLVDKAFQKQIGRNLKVYVDDMVINSRTEQEIIKDIKETFKTLRKINMKLNPKKCTFGVEEACSWDTWLNGKLASLNRFLVKSAKKSLPFFKTLRKCAKKSDFQWTTEAEAAFKQMKKLIAELPTLTAPMEKEKLIVYLAAAREAVSVVLMTEREAKQMLIYFVSRASQGPEINYTPMKKLVLALVHASKRLKRYFQAHPIVVITDHPIKQVLSKPEITGRLQK